MIRAGSPRKKERDALSTPDIDAAVGLVDTKPTTLAGAVALLQYAMHQEEGGDAWPTDADLQNDNGKSRSYHYFLCQNPGRTAFDSGLM